MNARVLVRRVTPALLFQVRDLASVLEQRCYKSIKKQNQSSRTVAILLTSIKVMNGQIA
jgi:hypothetical protein